MREVQGKYLNEKDAKKILEYCKGCRFFGVDVQIHNICTMIGWYDREPMSEIISYVKNCPCNKKCLVKAACRDEKCPIWIEYVQNVIEIRDKKNGRS